MSGYSIGLNALRTAMQLTDIAADNIANASTPGYHAKRATVVSVLGATIGNISQGLGSEVTDVQRLCDEFVERALTAHVQIKAALDQDTHTLTSIESLLAEPSSSGLDKQIGDFFESVSQLAGTPDDPILREQVVQKAVTVCATLNRIHEGLDLIQTQAVEATETAVRQMNDLTKRIASMNLQIRQAQTAGADASGLLDTRGQLIDQLAQFTDVALYNQEYGVVNISSGGMLIVSGPDYTPLHVATLKGQVVIASPNDDAHPLDITAGKLAGLLSAANDTVPAYQGQLDDLANALRRQLNLVFTQGIPLTGGFHSLGAETAFLSDTPVSELGYGVTAGTNERLTINVTDEATGEVTQYNLTLDTTQSATNFVASLAAAINAQVGHVSATVNQGKLSLTSDSGYAFDFAMPYDPNPAQPGDFSASDPTSPTILDAFTGSQDLNYDISFANGGAIGTDTITIQINVTDTNGNVVHTFTQQIDNTYKPGEAITLDNGLKLALSAGNVAAGDSFSFIARTTNDTAGVLDALGLNAFLGGLGAGEIHVSDRIVQDATQLAAAQRNMPGDNHKLLDLLTVRNAPLMSQGTRTLADYYRSVVADVAIQKTTKMVQQNAEGQQITTLENRRDSASGVSIDEEMLTIMQTRRIYEGALKYIKALNDLLTALVNAT